MGRKSELRPDICVIGTDPAGIDLAFAAGGLGVPTLLVTLAPADALSPSQQAALQRLRALGVGIITGMCRFIDKQRIVAEAQHIRARRYVLATSVSQLSPDIAGLQDAPRWHADQPVSQLLVIGGGASGVAIAQRARLAGARVALVCEGALLPECDPEAVGILRVVLERQGIQIRENRPLVAATIALDETTPAPGNGMPPQRVLTFADGAGPVLFTHLCLDCGIGTTPADLALETGGILSRDQRLVVNSQLETTNARVSVVGPAGGRMTSGENRAAEVSAVLGNILFRRKARHYPALAVRTVLTRPSIAEIGVREHDLKPGEIARYGFHRVALAGTGAARVEGEPSGHVKLIGTRDGRIAGVSILADNAPDLIPVFQLAMAESIKLQQLAALPFPVPAHAEAVGMIARQAVLRKAQTPASARLLRFLRLFG